MADSLGQLVCDQGKGRRKQYLEIGVEVGDGEPGSPGVLLVWQAIKSLGDGTEIEGADSRHLSDAVSERQRWRDAAFSGGLGTL